MIWDEEAFAKFRFCYITMQGTATTTDLYIVSEGIGLSIDLSTRYFDVRLYDQRFPT
jgi:hypothetical protein